MQLSKYYSEIFAFLVPSGRSELEFITAPSRDSQASTSSSSSSSRSSSLNSQDGPAFIGLSLKTRFHSSEAFNDLRNLSGGQKAIVSLALIFAIQKCNPLPFYVMDEIDAALDAKRRAKVSEKGIYFKVTQQRTIILGSRMDGRSK